MKAVAGAALLRHRMYLSYDQQAHEQAKECNTVPTWAAVVTGYGNMLARPLFREKHKPDMSEEDAMQLMKEALKACCHQTNASKLHPA